MPVRLNNLPIGGHVRIMFDQVTFTDEEGAEEFQNEGTCEFLLEDTDGNEVDSGPLSYVADSDGRYAVKVGPYPEAADPENVQPGEVVKRKIYYLYVTFSQGGDEVTYEQKLRAVYPT